MEGNEARKWYQRVDVIAALIGAAATIVAAIIGALVVIIPLFGNSDDDPEPVDAARAEVHSPVEARALGDDLILTIKFECHNLDKHAVRTEVATAESFEDSTLLKSLPLSKEHRHGPRATMTILDGAQIMTGYVRIVVVDEGGRRFPSNVVSFQRSEP